MARNRIEIVICRVVRLMRLFPTNHSNWLCAHICDESSDVLPSRQECVWAHGLWRHVHHDSHYQLLRSNKDFNLEGGMRRVGIFSRGWYIFAFSQDASNI